eukprot:TRINITY_DN51245_c0_g1_i1.p1 TRINITY_DN51245_c0_g1~~TRINITY_DN51245_c0_g1_i1.p1  ORF type:complete len:215 (+),score=40.51 TRINITY_DN51245_c0_g1_i1:77-721(+)
MCVLDFVNYVLCLFFFFSSRRRHTRCSGVSWAREMCIRDRYRDAAVTSIGGYDARGFIIGPPVALALEVPFFMLRKPGKMPNTIQSSSYMVEYGEREGMCISKDAVAPGDRVVLMDDLVATGGTLTSGIELVERLGGSVHECACIVDLQMFVDPPQGSGIPSRTQLWKQRGYEHVPVWGLVSEDALKLEGELDHEYEDDGVEPGDKVDVWKHTK